MGFTHGATELSPSGQAVGESPCQVYGDNITPDPEGR
jgi:hypothetical protein